VAKTIFAGKNYFCHPSFFREKKTVFFHRLAKTCQPWTRVLKSVTKAGSLLHAFITLFEKNEANGSLFANMKID